MEWRPFVTYLWNDPHSNELPTVSFKWFDTTQN